MRMPAAVELECTKCGGTIRIPVGTKDVGMVDGEYVVEVFADVDAVEHTCT